MSHKFMAILPRTVGLALIFAGIFIVFSLTYTDLYASLNQSLLKRQWRSLQSESGDDRHKQNTSISTASASPSGEINMHISPTTAGGAGDDTAATVTRQALKTRDRLDKNQIGVTQTTGRKKITHKEPFARIVIPRIGLDAIVVEGVDGEALKLGPGHMEETARPGEVGNMVISGHRVTHSRPFCYLNELKKGDPIHIYTEDSQKTTYFVVDKKIVAPTDVSVIQPTPDKTLTLTTCNPRFSAKTRLIIVAKTRD